MITHRYVKSRDSHFLRQADGTEIEFPAGELWNVVKLLLTAHGMTEAHQTGTLWYEGHAQGKRDGFLQALRIAGTKKAAKVLEALRFEFRRRYPDA